MSKNELHVGRLAQDAHVGQDAVVHKMVRANAIAAIFLADELVAPLRFFDFAGDGGDGYVAIKFDSGAHQRLDGLRVANQRAFHVVNAETVNQSVANHCFGFVAKAGEKSFAAGVRRIHVPVEHQTLAVASAFPKPRRHLRGRLRLPATSR